MLDWDRDESTVRPWIDLGDVLAGPLPDVAERLSRMLRGTWPHDALIIFTRECTGRPRKVAGDRDIVDRVTIGELDAVGQEIELGAVFEGTAKLGGLTRPIWAIRDRTDTLFVVVPSKPGQPPISAELIAAWFGIVATSIRHQVMQASPHYLAESRAASSERARTIAELTEIHDAVLTEILTVLRSGNLDDRLARTLATDLASGALVASRSASAADRVLAEESSTEAFARLQAELPSMESSYGVEIDYAQTSFEDVRIPGEMAHAARAMARTIATAFCAQPSATRLRIAWNCDGGSLVVEVRDHGPGTLDKDALLGQLTGRLRMLDGAVTVESIPDWGSRVTMTIPLNTPVRRRDDLLPLNLNPRELEVLQYLGLGRRNKDIALEIGISESTVKFHVAGLLQKLGVDNRAEAAAVAVRAGAIPSP
jgi:DNA-binding CsgD family transcriptional regulator